MAPQKQSYLFQKTRDHYLIFYIAVLSNQQDILFAFKKDKALPEVQTWRH